MQLAPAHEGACDGLGIGEAVCLSFREHMPDDDQHFACLGCDSLMFANPVGERIEKS